LEILINSSFVITLNIFAIINNLSSYRSIQRDAVSAAVVLVATPGK